MTRIRNHNEDLEYLLDGLIAEMRKEDEKVPLATVIKNLKKYGKLKQ